MTCSLAAFIKRVPTMAPRPVSLAPRPATVPVDLGSYHYVSDLMKFASTAPPALPKHPAIILGRTLVFAMEKPACWDEMDNTARWALKKGRYTCIPYPVRRLIAVQTTSRPPISHLCCSSKKMASSSMLLPHASTSQNTTTTRVSKSQGTQTLPPSSPPA